MSDPQPSSVAPADDPMPLPPPQPDIDLCCGNGCDPCIFDLHDLEMDKYRQALRAGSSATPTRTPPERGPRRRARRDQACASSQSRFSTSISREPSRIARSG